jgi:Transglycosylase SLT domain
MADQNILREYLVSLGFKVNQTDQRKFGAGLQDLDKKAMFLGKSVLGVATAAQAMVGVFAVQMEKLYYASRRIGSSVGNLQALEFGGKNIGIGADQMRGAIEGMARALRSNPGLQGLLNSLGVQVTGRDMSDVMLDFVGQLKKMPPFLAQRYASMFGIDADTLFMLTDGLEKLKEAREVRKQMAAEMGVDSDKAAEAAKEYANQWRDILERVGLVKDAFAIALLPAMKEMAGVTVEVLKDWTKIANTWQGAGDFWQRLKEGSTLVVADVEKQLGAGQKPGETKDQTRQRLFSDGLSKAGNAITNKARSIIPDWMRPANKRQTAPDQATPSTSAPGGATPPAGQQSAPGTGNETTAQMFARLEKRYGLPEGWLDRMWKKESGRGQNMYNAKSGAKGHFQFMDATAKDEGLADPYDLKQSAEAAAKYSAKMMKMTGGDPRAAAAAYNWGIGNVQRKGLGSAPAETRDYMDSVAGPAMAPSVTQNNTFNVSGVTNSREAADVVLGNQRDVNSDLIRNLTPKVQ